MQRHLVGSGFNEFNLPLEVNISLPIFTVSGTKLNWEAFVRCKRQFHFGTSVYQDMSVLERHAAIIATIT